jgi:hypothetical protein
MTRGRFTELQANGLGVFFVVALDEVSTVWASGTGDEGSLFRTPPTISSGPDGRRP